MTVLLLRHASAGERNEWTGDDTLRPLDERGRLQALALRDLSQRPIGRIVSSPYRRCVETVEPLAGTLGLALELDDRLAEGATAPLALSLLAELDGGLACTHGDVIEAVLGYGLRKGATAVADIGRHGVAVLEALPAPRV
jgi:phosphohistidine phosphatase SixA